jgi:hypothetical protein
MIARAFRTKAGFPLAVAPLKLFVSTVADDLITCAPMAVHVSLGELT